MSDRLHREYLDLAARRMDAALRPQDEARLTAHLATCSACREWVAGYEADRAALHGLRHFPAPPSNLWARTAAALDREQERASSRPILPRGLGAAAGVAATLMVALVIIGSGVIPGFPGPLALQTAGPLATPFAVEPQVVAYVSRHGDDVGLYVGKVDRVCPESAVANCQPLDADVRKVISFSEDFVPQQLSVAPDGRSAAIVGTSTSGGSVYALQITEPTTAPEPSATVAVGPTETAAASESSGTATASPSSTSSPLATTSPGTEATPTLAESPAASPAVAAILENVILSGEGPAYSADGTVLAFSARPADGSVGPDIYLWHVGAAEAVALTSDHSSYFASWLRRSIVGSRAVPLEEAGQATPESFLLDPETLEARTLAHAGWRPIVDPNGRFVIYWDGTLSIDGPSWREGTGGLYLAPWDLFDPASAEATAEPGTTEEPGETGAPEEAPMPQATPSAEGTALPGETALPVGETPLPEETSESASSLGPSPLQSTVQKLDPRRDYQRDPILAWEVRWSPDGRWFGAWIGDSGPRTPPSSEPEPGRLTVAPIDPLTGRIERARVELDNEPALHGFALGDHRIAWATVPGPDLSSVRLLVWDDRGRGLLHTRTGDGSETLPGF